MIIVHQQQPHSISFATLLDCKINDESMLRKNGAKHYPTAIVKWIFILRKFFSGIREPIIFEKKTKIKITHLSSKLFSHYIFDCLQPTPTVLHILTLDVSTTTSCPHCKSK